MKPIRLSLDELAQVRCIADGLLPAELELSADARPGEVLSLNDDEGVTVARLDVREVPSAGRVRGTVGLVDPPTEPTYPRLRHRPADLALGTGPIVAFVGVRAPSSEQVAAALGELEPGTWAEVLGLAVAGGVRADDIGHHRAVASWLALRNGWTGPGTFRLVLTPLWSGSPDAARRSVAEAFGATRTVLVAADPAAPVGTGATVLFSGLSGSGKSTIAARLVGVLTERYGRSVTLLDGDNVRTHLSSELGFSRADRETNVRRIGWVAAEVTKHGGLAVAAPIAPHADTRAEVRRMIEHAGGPGSFLLVHVSTPLAECERRDRKGLYAKARRGEIGEFTGISDPYEQPTDAELTVDTTGTPVDDAVAQIVAALVARHRL